MWLVLAFALAGCTQRRALNAADCPGQDGIIAHVADDPDQPGAPPSFDRATVTAWGHDANGQSVDVTVPFDASGCAQIAVPGGSYSIGTAVPDPHGCSWYDTQHVDYPGGGRMKVDLRVRQQCIF